VKGEIKCVLMDIEGTTTSVSFVYDVLFPYFLTNVDKLLFNDSVEVVAAFDEVKELVKNEGGLELLSRQDCINQLVLWCKEDRKVTPLKFLQGVIWEEGYLAGTLVSHVYDDVPHSLKEWYDNKIELAIFSSGSVEAQKLIFKFANQGDLSNYLSAYFDTVTGPKRETNTYKIIADQLQFPASSILFLSDIREELMAAEEAGMQTIQLVRPGTTSNWKNTAENFTEINC
jgi:enolase-phosphatase E1